MRSLAAPSHGGLAQLQPPRPLRPRRPCSRCRADATSASLVVPTPTFASALELLAAAERGEDLRPRLRERLLALAAPLAAAPAPASHLAGRIAELRASEARQAEVAELLAASTGAKLQSFGFALHTALPSLSEPSTAAAEPEELACWLYDEPGAVAELNAHCDTIIPRSTPVDAVCRLDAVSGGRLYLGAIQFGYFVRCVTDWAAEGPGRSLPEAQMRSMAKQPRSREAWAAARSRAAALWAVTDPERLNDFCTRVTLAPSSAASEFYAPAPAREGAARPEAAEGSELPSVAELIPLRAGCIRRLMAETALFGWTLRGEETWMEFEAGLSGDGWSLLTPPAQL